MRTPQQTLAPWTGTIVRLHSILDALNRRVLSGGPAERGDVPGWVLVTLMSALLVVGLLGVANDELQNVFRKAIDSVSTP